MYGTECETNIILTHAVRTLSSCHHHECHRLLFQFSMRSVSWPAQTIFKVKSRHQFENFSCFQLNGSMKGHGYHYHLFKRSGYRVFVKFRSRMADNIHTHTLSPHLSPPYRDCVVHNYLFIIDNPFACVWSGSTVHCVVVEWRV